MAPVLSRGSTFLYATVAGTTDLEGENKKPPKGFWLRNIFSFGRSAGAEEQEPDSNDLQSTFLRRASTADLCLSYNQARRTAQDTVAGSYLRTTYRSTSNLSSPPSLGARSRASSIVVDSTAEPSSAVGVGTSTPSQFWLGLSRFQRRGSTAGNSLYDGAGGSFLVNPSLPASTSGSFAVDETEGQRSSIEERGSIEEVPEAQSEHPPYWLRSVMGTGIGLARRGTVVTFD